MYHISRFLIIVNRFQRGPVQVEFYHSYCFVEHGRLRLGKRLEPKRLYFSSTDRLARRYARITPVGSRMFGAPAPG